LATAVNFDSLDAIRAAGFHGFNTIRELQTSRCSDVPREAGVYMVARNRAHECAFAARSCGGRFKGNDPAVPITRLHRYWIEDAIVLYIGKAGGGPSNAVLQKRLWDYMRFGRGEPVGHWGGRAIWQLENCRDLIVCWKPSGERDAAMTESELIHRFTAIYGRRPFANLRS
jgi:hypothetical protein